MSNQIELIEKLYAKTKTYKVPKEPKEGIEQLDIKVTPLSLEDMGLMNIKENAPFSELSKNVKTMFSKSLKITEEQAGKISIEFMEDISSAIMDANNFKDEDLKKTGIKDFIKKKQEQMKIKVQEDKENAESNRTT